MCYGATRQKLAFFILFLIKFSFVSGFKFSALEACCLISAFARTRLTSNEPRVAGNEEKLNWCESGLIDEKYENKFVRLVFPFVKTRLEQQTIIITHRDHTLIWENLLIYLKCMERAKDWRWFGRHAKARNIRHEHRVCWHACAGCENTKKWVTQ